MWSGLAKVGQSGVGFVIACLLPQHRDRCPLLLAAVPVLSRVCAADGVCACVCMRRPCSPPILAASPPQFARVVTPLPLSAPARAMCGLIAKRRRYRLRPIRIRGHSSSEEVRRPPTVDDIATEYMQVCGKGCWMCMCQCACVCFSMSAHVCVCVCAVCSCVCVCLSLIVYVYVCMRISLRVCMCM